MPMPSNTLILRLSRDAVIVRAADGRITAWNAAAETLYGYSAAEAQGRVLDDLLHTHWPVSYSDAEAVLSLGLVWTGELQRTTRGGEVVVVDSRQAEDRLGADGAAVIVEVNWDVSAARAAQTALQRSEERYRALIEATDQYVWTNSPEGYMTGDQPGWSRLTGQTSEQYHGYGWAQHLHPEDQEAAVLTWQESVRTRSVYEMEQRVLGHDGTYRSFLVRAVPLLDEDGTLREWVGLHTDVSELKHAEQALKAWSAELEQQVAAQTHDLRAA
ncbi:PAS domain-containing protein, partial [Deinococcus sp.]|uniref:PAS domain-containing protein n=1 Tax=Deinococcus sp. TaxID=47478 RepID=UPI0028699E75